MFVWHAYLGALHICYNLCNRKIINDNLYPICRLAPEIVGHALWSCEAAKDVWCQRVRVVQKIAILGQLSFLEIWQNLVLKMNIDKLSKVAFIARQIWFRRNQFIHHSLLSHPTPVLQTVKKEFILYKDSSIPTSPSSSNLMPYSTNSASREKKWIRPSHGQFKWNWDATMDSNNGKLGVRDIIHNETGAVIGTYRAMRCFNDCSFIAGAYGRLGITKVTVEGDSLQVVSSLKNDKID